MINDKEYIFAQSLYNWDGAYSYYELYQNSHKNENNKTKNFDWDRASFLFVNLRVELKLELSDQFEFSGVPTR